MAIQILCILCLGLRGRWGSGSSSPGPGIERFEKGCAKTYYRKRSRTCRIKSVGQRKCQCVHNAGLTRFGVNVSLNKSIVARSCRRYIIHMPSCCHHGILAVSSMQILNFVTWDQWEIKKIELKDLR